MEITTKTHHRILESHKVWRMRDPLESYDGLKGFHDAFDGSFTNLDKVKEDAKTDKWTDKKV